MSIYGKMVLAALAGAFISITPALAAGTATSASGDTEPAASEGFREKAEQIIDEAREKADSAADKVEEALGIRKDAPNAPADKMPRLPTGQTQAS